MIKKLFSQIAVVGLALLTLVTQEGKTYQFSPTTLETRQVKHYYLPLVNVPVHHEIVQKQEYMLSPLWRELKLLPQSATTTARWVNSLDVFPGRPSIQGPAYALMDVKTVGSPTYWHHFTEAYPREAKKLFRRVIALLKSGQIERATAVLAENAWMPISV